MKKLVIANWKMNGDPEFIENYFDKFQLNDSKTEIIFAPPFPLISYLKFKINNNYQISAQDCHHQDHGAFTGNVSPQLLKNIGVNYVIIGHSERRDYHNETNQLIAKKSQAAISNNLTPIICIGETKQQREEGSYKKILTTQIAESIPNSIDNQQNIIIAYEPVWAIGTGLVPTNQQIAEIFLLVKEKLRHLTNLSILYGGSVNDKNAAELSTIEYLSGFLVGSASLDPEKFSQIILATI